MIDKRAEWREKNRERLRAIGRKAYYKNRERNKGNVWARQLRIRHGLTVEEWVNILRMQDFKCAICRKEFIRVGKEWTIDHDHKCCPSDNHCKNCVRGILCATCNTALGHFKDSTQVIERALNYLDLWEQKQLAASRTR